MPNIHTDTLHTVSTCCAWRHNLTTQGQSWLSVGQTPAPGVVGGLQRDSTGFKGRAVPRGPSLLLQQREAAADEENLYGSHSESQADTSTPWSEAVWCTSVVFFFNPKKSSG